MNKPHKWAKEIKAWADGAEIECRQKSTHGEFTSWWVITDPEWRVNPITEYRIKPQPKEPQYLYVYAVDNQIRAFNNKTEIIDCKDPKSVSYMGKIKLEVDNG